MSSPNAIVFDDVSKIYRLYDNKWQMAKAAFGRKLPSSIPEFFALKNVNLTIKKGERIGLVGRNGAGKSTLLKLITGNFAPTSGTITINGNVQALMNIGVGFHPEFTGLDNIKASLHYNGLNPAQLKAAIDDIVDFVELGDFLHQPLKTYSLGMQSRLFFAVSTAIQPEILIIDEVLGAGDAYFSAKCAARMKKLTHSGCTLILVSHSTQQVLQFCETAYWLEAGEIVMQGEAIDVIKSYEAFSKKLEVESTRAANATAAKTSSIIQSKWLREKLLNDVLQSATMLPLEQSENLPSGVSRWPATAEGLKIYDIKIRNNEGAIVSHVFANDTLEIDMSIVAEKSGNYDVYFMILLFTEDGRWLTRHCSDKFHLTLEEKDTYTMRMHYDKLLLGQGRYFFSAGIYSVLDLHDLSTARYYDLLSRSFEFSVYGGYPEDTTLFHHPAEWVAQTQELLDAALPLSS